MALALPAPPSTAIERQSGHSDPLTIRKGPHSGTTAVQKSRKTGRALGAIDSFKNPLAVTTWAGNGTNATVDGTGSAASFRDMGGAAIIGAFGYVGTTGSIRKVDLSTAAVTTRAGSATQVTTCVDSTDPAQVRFSVINDMASDGTYLYTANFSCSKIRRTAVATGATSTVAPLAVAHLTLAPDGYLYATNGTTVYKVNPGTGSYSTFTTMSGTAAAITSDATYLYVKWQNISTPTISKVLLADPSQKTTFLTGSPADINVLMSSGDYLYSGAATSTGGTVRRYAKSDASWVAVAGTAALGYQDGTGADSWFNNIQGIASDGSIVWIADSGNHRFRKGVTADPLPSVQPPEATTLTVLPEAKVTTFAGNGTNATVDGTGTSASFARPRAITKVGSFGYVATDGSIRKMNLTTAVVTTLAGSATQMTSMTDSTDPTQVRFCTIGDITTDDYYLYTTNSCVTWGPIRRTSIATGATSSIVSVSGVSYIVMGPDGYLYGAGGTNTTVYKIDPVSGTFSTFTTFTGSASALAADGTDLYVKWQNVNTPTISKVAFATGAQSTFLTGTPADVQGLTSAGGILYGAGANSSGQAVWGYDKGIASWYVIAGLRNNSGYIDAIFTDARFNYVAGLVVDGTNLWITDRDNYRIRKAELGMLPAQQFGSYCAGVETHAISPCGTIAEPVNTAIGNYVNTTTDATLPGIGVPFAFTRTYNSPDATSGPLGPGWTHALNASLTVLSSSNVQVRTEDGQQELFLLMPDATYAPAPGVRDALVKVGSTYTLTRHDQVVYAFDSTGRETSIKDRNNKGLTLAYSGGVLTSITDSVGRVITLTYTSGLLTGLSLPDGRSVSYGYTSGRLTSVTDMRNGVTSYTYDSGGRLATIVDQNNHTVVQNVYDTSSGRVIQQTDGLGRISTFTWDANTQTSTFTDARGKVWKDIYSSNVLIKRIDPLNDTTTYGYDMGLNTATVTDPRGNATSFSHDARGNLLTRKAPAPLSYQESWAYNSRNDPTSYTDGRGNTTTYGYDGAGNLTSMTRSGNILTQYGRDPGGTGLLTSITDPNNRTTTLGYDSSGNLTSITDPLGNKTTMGYDSSGRMTSKVEARGNVQGGNPADYTWSYTYDAADHVLTQTDPLGNLTTWVYDPAGNLTGPTDANSHATSYGYDADNRLTSVTAPDNTVTSYSYDFVGNLASRTDANGHITSYGYDDANRLTSVTSPINQVWSYGYDGNGNVTAKTLPSAGTVTYTYDVLNRLAAIDYSDTTPDVSFAYDANSNRTSMSDGAGTETSAYDTLNRLTSVTRGSDVFSYQYDPASNLTQRTYPDSTVITYGYDNAERLSTVASGGATTTYGYDAASNVTSVTLPISNGYVQSYAYDRAGRLTQVDNAKAGSSLSKFTYTLDPVGNPTQVVTTTETMSYGYDALDRLTSACYTPPTCSGSGTFINYTYDPVGNRLTEVRSAGTTSYSYNAADQLTQTSGPSGNVSYGYDSNGNETSTGSRTFAYDLENRMTSTSSGGSIISYTYGGNGRRLQASAGPQPPDKTNYHWDPNASLPLLALERDGNNGLLRRYLYGSGQLLSMYTGGGNYYFLQDMLESTANLTSSAGAAEWTYAYEPFGTTRTETKNDPAAPTNLMRFTGQLFDTDTSLYHLRARQYDPVTGRFLALDPAPESTDIPYVGSYVYATDRPSVFVDPRGQGAECSRNGYTDVNVSFFLFDFGWMKDACGRHVYGGFGVGGVGISETFSKSSVSCVSYSVQGFTPVGAGGSYGRGFNSAEPGVPTHGFAEVGFGTFGGGAYLNFVRHCPAGNP